MRSVSVYVVCLLIGLAVPRSARSRSTGPPDGRTNAPGQGVCTGCHQTNPVLNSGGGMFEIGGVPATYDAGTPYSLTVTIDQAGQMRWGFELCVLTDRGTQAGTITVTDTALMQTSTTNGITYIKHKSAGTRAGQPGPTSWSFEWIAPAVDSGRITFYAAGNAANNNNANTGDFIYTTTAQTLPRATDIEGARIVPNRFALGAGYPNPFNPTITLPFTVPRPARVEIAIFSLSGQRVKTLVRAEREPGRHEARWDGTDDAGRRVASGAYLAVMTTLEGVRTRTLILAR